MSEPTTLTVEDGLARLTLNRPDAYNTLDRELAKSLMEAAVRCAHGGDVRAVLLTATGNNFCGGGDLKSFHAQGDGIDGHVREVTYYLHAACSAFARMDAPLVIAVQGAAAGAGLSIALLGDLVYAGESAFFTMAYTAAGLSPDGGSTFMLPRVVGLRRAQELTLTNRRLTAAEAVDWGIVTAVVPDDSLQMHAAEVARKLAHGPSRANACWSTASTPASRARWSLKAATSPPPPSSPTAAPASTPSSTSASRRSPGGCSGGSSSLPHPGQAKHDPGPSGIDRKTGSRLCATRRPG